MSNTSTSVILTCSVDGHPTPTVKWFQENRQVSSSKTLVIPKDRFDAVNPLTYCQVENAVSKVTTESVTQRQCMQNNLNILTYYF